MSGSNAPVPAPRRNVARSLRRGGTVIGQMIGGYFGVTEESQAGGWGEMAQRRAEEGPIGFGTLGRRRRTEENINPPDYNAVEMGNFGNMQSFEDLDSSDSSDEDVFPAPQPDGPPPRYNDLPPSSGVPGRISMFGHDDPARVQAVSSRPQQQRVTVQTGSTDGDQSTGDTITDPDRAVQYYLEYMRIEKVIKRRQSHEAASEFFGDGRERSMSDSQGEGFRGRLNSTVDPADLRCKKKKQKKTGRTKLERQSTMVRQELESLPTFWPIFVVGVTFVQMCVVVVLMVLNGYAPFDYQPQQHTSNYPSLVNVSGNASVTYYRFTNLWFGIGLLDLIHSGAKFSPCMRKDVAIINRNIQQRNREEENGGLGCCQNKIWVGTALQEDCVTSVDPDLNNTLFLNTPCKDTTRLLANFHPCCISITGQCQVMHIRECLDRGGVYHSDKDSCNDTNCLDSVCGISGIGTENGDPLRPSGTQLWRLITSLFVHLGVIHFVVIAVVQLYLGIKIEVTVGFVRIALIYIISGVGGNLISAIFIPYQVNGGGSPAVFGLLGVIFVELFQFWQVVERAWLEVVKLSSIFIFLLAFGTLPFIDNLANIGGFVFGIPSAIIFLPYITFGKVDAWRKRILLIICIPLLILMFAVGLIVFYLVPDTDFCEGCHYFNCIPYTPSFCQNEVSDPDPDVFAL